MSSRALVAGDPRTIVAIAMPIADRELTRLEVETERLRRAHELSNARRLAALNARETLPLPRWAPVALAIYAVWWWVRRGLEIAVNG